LLGFAAGAREAVAITGACETGTAEGVLDTGTLEGVLDTGAVTGCLLTLGAYVTGEVQKVRLAKQVSPAPQSVLKPLGQAR